MSDASPHGDLLTLSGLGGLFNGEVFALQPGESGTVGATSLATFPVSLCRNYRRLEGDPSREELLTRLAPEHVRFVYVGDGRLVVENLAGQDVLVGRREVAETMEVDLTEGRVEVEFGYGERIVASVPESPETFLEFASPRNEAAEVEGVFMALLEPDGPLAAVAEKLARKEREDYELLDEPGAPADPAAETGPIPIVPLPPEERPKRRRWFRGGPAVFLSALFHLVVVLGLFAWIRANAVPPQPPPAARVRVQVPQAPRTAPAPAPAERPDRMREVPDAPAAEPAFEETETVRAAPAGGHPGETGLPGSGRAGAIGLGSGAPGGGPGGEGPVLAAGLASGGPETFRQRNLELALEWLARHQMPDGSWGAISSLSRCGRCTAPGRRDYPVAMTGLALAAFAGAGHTHRSGTFRDTVTGGMKWLLKAQRDNGSFHPATAGDDERPMYGDALATFALAELYHHSRSPLLRTALTRAAGHLVATQNPYAGWRYRPGARDSDTSVTGWVVLALTATEDAGLPVNPAARFGAVSWVEDVSDPVTFRVGYVEKGRGSLGMTATGITIRLLAGRDAGEEPIRKGERFLRDNLPSWPEKDFAAEPGNPPDTLYWYFGAIAAGRLGSDLWREWKTAVRDALGPRQERSGEMRGSFPPSGRWSRVGGRVFATAIAALTLTVVLDSPAAFR